MPSAGPTGVCATGDCAAAGGDGTRMGAAGGEVVPVAERGEVIGIPAGIVPLVGTFPCDIGEGEYAREGIMRLI